MVESRLSNTASSPSPEVLYAPVGNPNCWLYAAWLVMTGDGLRRVQRVLDAVVPIEAEAGPEVDGPDHPLQDRLVESHQVEVHRLLAGHRRGRPSPPTENPVASVSVPELSP